MTVQDLQYCKMLLPAAGKMSLGTGHLAAAEPLTLLYCIFCTVHPQVGSVRAALQGHLTCLSRHPVQARLELC